MPAPEFIVNPSDIMVKFTTLADRVVNGLGNVTDEVTEIERRIMDELRINSGSSYAMIAENLRIRKKKVAAHIKSLKEKGIIPRVRNNKTGQWK